MITRIGLVSILVLSLTAGCGSSEVYTDCPNGDAVAISNWFENRKTIAVDVVGESPEEAEAGRFFRRLTGVEIRFDWGYAGGVRYEGTAEDLAEIDSWFEANCTRLYWDPETESVLVSDNR